MTVCNSCRYCEGLCAVFPAMEMRRRSPTAICPTSPICAMAAEPATMIASSRRRTSSTSTCRKVGEVRAESSGRYAWPTACSGLFRATGRRRGDRRRECRRSSSSLRPARGGRLCSAAGRARRVLQMMPHNAMVALFGAFSSMRSWRSAGRAVFGATSASPPAPSLRPPRSGAPPRCGSLRYLEAAASAATMRRAQMPTVALSTI